jgi:hypothetical protein
VLPESAIATGGSFTGVTLSVAVAWLEMPPLLSVAVKWKLVLAVPVGVGLEVEGDGAAAGSEGRAGD